MHNSIIPLVVTVATAALASPVAEPAATRMPVAVTTTSGKSLYEPKSRNILILCTDPQASSLTVSPPLSLTMIRPIVRPTSLSSSKTKRYSARERLRGSSKRPRTSTIITARLAPMRRIQTRGRGRIIGV